MGGKLKSIFQYFYWNNKKVLILTFYFSLSFQHSWKKTSSFLLPVIVKAVSEGGDHECLRDKVL